MICELLGVPYTDRESFQRPALALGAANRDPDKFAPRPPRPAAAGRVARHARAVTIHHPITGRGNTNGSGYFAPLA
jgi:hypothetical protein